MCRYKKNVGGQKSQEKAPSINLSYCLILSTLLCVQYMEQKFGVARAGIYCIKEGKFVRSILFYPTFKIFILGL